MELPGFADAFRAPARFAMMAVLALSVAAGLAVVRLMARLPDHRRLTATAAVAAAILAESWIHPFPVAAAPAPLEVPAEVPASAVVLELPIGVFEDALAMYHSTLHHRRTVNGLSGYVPPYYKVLTRAIEERNVDVLAALRRYGDVAIFSRRDRSDAAQLTGRLRALPGTTPLPDTSTHHVTLAAMQPAPLVPSQGALEAARLAETVTQPHASAQGLADHDLQTAWASGSAQTGAEVITLTLEQSRMIAGVRIDSGPHATAFARTIAIDTSADGRQWDTVVTADGAALAMEAALRDSRRMSVVLTFAPRAATRVRIRQLGQATDEWVVAELRVLAEPARVR
jgi:hypothetical protein